MSAYEKTHSTTTFPYGEEGVRRKACPQRAIVAGYGLGNTGTTSLLCSDHVDRVLAVDEDELAVDTLYRRLKGEVRRHAAGRNWQHFPEQAARPGKSFDNRSKPELICAWR
jgi:hypothetical protein